jgi:hypothetical protein
MPANRNMLKFITTLLVIFTASCSFLGDGENTLIKQKVNSGQTKTAFLFMRESGATVADSYQVTVTDSDNEFDKKEPGNVFTVDTDHGATKLDSTSINLTWLGDDKLQIDYDKRLRTFVKERKVNGVTVIYNPR